MYIEINEDYFINAFKDEIAEMYETEQKDGGVTDSFRLGNFDDIPFSTINSPLVFKYILSILGR